MVPSSIPPRRSGDAPDDLGGGRLSRWSTASVLALSLGSLLLGFGGQMGWADASGGASGPHVHGLLEWVSVFLGFVCFALAVVAYRSRRDPALLVLGTGLLCAAVMDGFHTLAALHLIEGASPDSDLIPFTWAASRVFHAGVRLTGALLLLWAPARHVTRAAFGASGIMALAAGALVIALIGDPDLPHTQYEGLITRPWDVAPLILFAVAAALFLRLDRSRNTTFTHALVVAAAPDVAAQVHMAFGSDALFDAHFNAAHALKSLAYLVPLMGLFSEYQGFLDAVERARAFVRVDATLTRVTDQIAPEAEELPAETELARQPLAELAATLGFDLGYLYLYEPSTDSLVPSTLWAGGGDPPAAFAELTAASRFARGEGLPGQILAAGRAVWMTRLDPEVDPRFALAPELRGGIGIPVATRHRFFAVMELYDARPRPQDSLLLALAQSAGDRLGAALSLVRTHRAMQAARYQAEAGSRAKTEFLANMSHELRTPLNGVIGALGLMLEDPLEPEQEDLGRTALGSARALLAVLQDLLDISRLEADKLELVSAPASIEALASVVHARFAPDAARRGLELRLRLRLGELPPRVMVDAARLEQVLDNLLDNALRFTESGWVELRVGGGLVATGVYGLVFEIEDTGVGIPEDQLRRIFEKFEQADTSSTRRHEGSGLGLALCDRLVALMGGRLELRSEVGTGSVFFFSLPCPAVASDAGAEAIGGRATEA